MMHFPAVEQLDLPCCFERYIAGKLHADGRRYLPLLVLHLPMLPRRVEAPASATFRTLGVVDRHHVVDPALEGRDGTARLVLLLSRLHVQSPPYRQGFVAEEGVDGRRVSTMPAAYGQVHEVLAWEVSTENLPYESLYVELLLDVGFGIVGVRTSVTAVSLDESLGTTRIEPGDWIEVLRSRIDILGFTAF